MSRVKYEMKVSDNFDNLLGHLAFTREVTKAEIIRRAIASYAAINMELRKDPSSKLSITDSQDVVLRDVCLP